MTALNNTRQTNVRKAPQTPRGNGEQQLPTTSSENNLAAASSSTTTTVELFPSSANSDMQSLLRRYQIESLKKLHAECFGRPMPAPISAAVLRDLDAGTPSAYYRYAMIEATYAPRPSWRYAAAIVKRCKEEMVDPGELPV